MQLLENLEEMPETIENTQGNYQITPVSVATIQSLGKRLAKKSGYNVIQSAQVRQLSDFTFDLGASLLTIDTLNRRTYSIPFLEKRNPNSTFNLILVGDSADNILEHYVLEYEFNSSQFQNFEETNDLILSGATIKRYSFSSFFNDSNPSFLERCSGVMDNNGDPIPCETISNLANATLIGAGGGGNTSGSPTYTIDFGAGGSISCTASIVKEEIQVCPAKDHPGSGCTRDNIIQWVVIWNCTNSAQKRVANEQALMECQSCYVSDFGSPAFALTRDAAQIDNLLTDYPLSQWHLAYLSNSTTFASELRAALIYDPNLDQEASIFTINAGMNGALSGNFNRAFMLSVEGLLPESDADYTQDPIQILFQSYFLPRYLMLKNLNPTWSSTKLFYETSKDALHLNLDGIGLIEGIGTPADLINAGLYYLEGDNLSGNLSLVAATPVIGLFSTTIKGAIKLKGIIPGTSIRITHVWAKNGNTILFGGTNLRKVMGLTDPSKHAHHILPLEHAGHPVIQKAAQLKENPFHLSELNNGIGVPALQNTNHPAYNNRVFTMLENYNKANPNASPEQAYLFLNQQIAKIRSEIELLPPGGKINDITWK